MLGEHQLWQRIKQLEGQVVYTLEQQKPNQISRVTDESIEIEGRATAPTRNDILLVYRQLHQTGQITAADLYGGNSILNHPYAKKSGRIIMATLATAVPDEIDVIKRNKTQGLSGIRLKSNPLT